MLVHFTFSSVLLGNSCLLSWPFFLIVFCLFVVLVISHFGFEGGICFLIAPVPVHCFLITFKKYFINCNRERVNKNSNTQGQLTLKSLVRCGRNSYSSKLWSMFLLPESFQSIRLKTNKEK